MGDISDPSIADPDGYRHIPNDVILAIGKLVVIAGNLKGDAHHVIEALGVADKRNLAFESLIGVIKRRVRDFGVPNCATSDHAELQEAIRRWWIQAKAAVSQRHSVLHSFFYFKSKCGRAISGAA